MITPWERPLRIARRLRGAAAAHDARLWRVGARAVRLRSGGWRLGEAASFGLLDPAAGLAAFSWAIPATEMERLQEALNPEDAARRAEDKRHLAAICARHGLPTIPRPPSSSAPGTSRRRRRPGRGRSSATRRTSSSSSPSTPTAAWACGPSPGCPAAPPTTAAASSAGARSRASLPPSPGRGTWCRSACAPTPTSRG